MNGNLEAVLYDCKHIGSIARDIEQRLKLLESTAGRSFHDSIRKDYPNITNVEELSTAVIILLTMLGLWIGIDKDIFIYVAGFCIFWNAWSVLAWAVNKIDDRIERKKIREYFERLHKEK